MKAGVQSYPAAIKGGELPSASGSIYDRANRQLTYLRVSVTDRCNYSCHYCMPAGGWTASPRQELLSLEEIARVVAVMATHGVKKVRITGGEPLLRKNVTDLIRWIADTPGISEVALTTNGHLLPQFAEALKDSGLTRLTVSVDTFDPMVFEELTGGDLGRVLRGIEEAQRVGFDNIGINVVALNKINSGRLADITRRCWSRGLTPRFIELMPIGGLPYQQAQHGYSYASIFDELDREFGLVETTKGAPAHGGPARYWSASRGPWLGRQLGTISPMSDGHFCGECNRARLTARGGFRPCLANDEEVSLLHALRRGDSDLQVASLVSTAMAGKLDAHRLTDGTFIPLTVMTGIGG